MPRWFGGRDECSDGIGRILTSGATLESLAQGVREGGRICRDWLTVDQSLGSVRQGLGTAREQLQRGKSVNIADNFFVAPHQRPFDWKKFMVRAAIIGTVLLLSGGAWFARYFLGVGAPEAGEGIVGTASMEDREKVVTILAVMNESFVLGDVDRFMTVIANDFSDDVGHGRRQDLAATIGAQPPSRRNGGSSPTPGAMIAGTLAAGAHPGRYNGNHAQRGNLIADTLTSAGAEGGRRDKMIVSFDWQTAGSERTSIVDEPGATRGLSASKTLAVAYNIQQNDGGQHRRPDRPEGVHEDQTPTLNSDSRIMAGVRRLTPTECERLQGFPDGHTAGQSDSARYRQLGNAVAVPVARWIGERIASL